MKTLTVIFGLGGSWAESGAQFCLMSLLESAAMAVELFLVDFLLDQVAGGSFLSDIILSICNLRRLSTLSHRG
jgi:hypothetical protein